MLLIFKLFRYILLGIIIFFVVDRTILFFLRDMFTNLGVNISKKVLLMSVFITCIILGIIYLTDSHVENMKNYNTDHFDNLSQIELELSEDSIPPKNDVETKVVTDKTVVSDLGQKKPIQTKVREGDDIDYEMVELERITKEVSEIKQEKQDIVYALRQMLEENGISNSHMSDNEIIETYKENKKKDSEIKTNPSLLITGDKWLKTKNYYSTGCSCPVSTVDDSYVKVEDLY